MRLPRVLVTGATGFLGPFAVEALAGLAEVATSSRQGGGLPVDLAETGGVERLLALAQPDFVLHLAACSRLADCERDPERARRLNALVPAAMAARMRERLLFVSTDLVFDGRRAPYAPDHPPAPLSQYGLTKVEGEDRVLAAGGRVVRLPLLFGPDAAGRGASATIRAAIAAGRPLSLFTNEYRTPLHAADAARGLSQLLFAVRAPRCAHLPGPERVSRWAFAQRLCAVHGLAGERLHPAECDDPARPRDVSLAGAWTPPRDLAAMLQEA